MHWQAVARVAAALQLVLLRPWCEAASHYSCTSQEVSGELQGETGVACAPRCQDGTLDCPLDVPTGTTAQPQCMLQDVDQVTYCGLLCQIDAQCPSGASCRKIVNTDISMCIHTLSFSEWAKLDNRKKLNVELPKKTGQSAHGFQIAKAYAALQSLKRRYGMADGDADVLIVKELLSATTANAVGSQISAAASSAAGTSHSSPAVTNKSPVWEDSVVGSSVIQRAKHDISYLSHNVREGLPGLQREIHDTIWNVEHLGKHGVGSGMLLDILMIALVYLGVGSAYKYQTMGARGIDMIPHIGFWMEYPKLVSDGMNYSMMIVGGWIGQPSLKGGGGYQPVGSDRDTFSHFEPNST